MAVRVGTLGLDCRTCSDAQKIERGCEIDSPVPGKWNVDGWKFQRCPLKIITQESLEYLEAYDLYSMGILPNGTGWLNHSKKFMDAMRIVHREVQEMRAKNAGK